MKGRKWSAEKKSEAIEAYIATDSYAEASRMTGVGSTAILAWVQQMDPAEVERRKAEYRAKNAERFAQKATHIIETGLDLIARRLETAADFESELAKVCEMIAADESIPDKKRKELLTKLDALKIQSIRDLTTAVGTMYDKRALAQGDSTDKTTVEIRLPEGFDEYAG